MSDGEKPLVQNASDKRQVREAGKKAKRNAEWRKEEIRTVLSTRQGRKWMWRKLEQYRVFSSSFAADPHATAFNEGRRAAGLDLLFDVNSLEPEVFLLMRKEANEDAERGF